MFTYKTLLCFQFSPYLHLPLLEIVKSLCCLSPQLAFYIQALWEKKAAVDQSQPAAQPHTATCSLTPFQ